MRLNALWAQLLGPLLTLAAFASPAQARWLEARSTNFFVYGQAGESSLRKSVELLENYDRLLRVATGTKEPPSRDPLRVYIVNAQSALRLVSDVPPEVAGFYQTGVDGTAALAVRGTQPGLGGEEVLLHEYAHHFMARYYPAYYPGWYREGFAEYMMTARFTGNRAEVGRFSTGRAITLLTGKWMPLDDMLGNKPIPTSRDRMGQFYAQSWLMVHYLFATSDRTAALLRYLAELHRGTPEPAAFTTAFGMDHAAFEQELKRYMNGRISYGAWNWPPAESTTITVRPLPPSADSLLLHHVALTLNESPPEREAATIAAIRAAAARFPEDAYARRVLARAEITAGDRAAGTATVDALLQADPNDAELRYLRGLGDFLSGKDNARAQDAHYAAAHPWFTRAVQADPGYYTALYRLSLTSVDDSGRVTDLGLRALIAACELAPLVGEIAFDAAQALEERGRYAEAANALLPIATHPHGGDTSWIRAKLKQLQERARQAAAARTAPAPAPAPVPTPAKAPARPAAKAPARP